VTPEPQEIQAAKDLQDQLDLRDQKGIRDPLDPLDNLVHRDQEAIQGLRETQVGHRLRN